MKHVLTFLPMLLMVWLLIGEATVQLAARALPAVERALIPPSEWQEIEARLPDPVLRTRGNPAYPDHDAAGFRNLRRLERASVVALGDSQTYGSGVDLVDAWPMQLARLDDRSVYNMGFPAYGPYHYSLLLDDALALEPEWVVVGVYYGNDIFDLFRSAIGLEDPASVLASETVPELRALEEEADFRSRITDAMGCRPLPAVSAEGSANAGEPSALRVFLSDHSKLYGLARALRQSLSERRSASRPGESFERAVAGLSEEQQSLCTPVELDGWRTILTITYRGLVVDGSDPRIEAAARAMAPVLVDMDTRARSAGARLLVAVIPTKESVFADRLGDRLDPGGLNALAAWETRHREAMLSELQAEGVSTLDLLPVLRAAPAPPYFSDADGHPNSSGHEAIARAVAEVVSAAR